MIGVQLPYILVEIQTVGPEGGKLVWFFLFIAFALLILFSLKKKTIQLSRSSSALSVKLEKNKVYHPSVVHLKILNKRSKGLVINHPVIRFKKGRSTKAFKIKSVNASSIYPLFLEANKIHELPVALQPFYDYNPKLKKYSRLRLEFTYEGGKLKKTKYLLLKSTLFRKA